MECSSVLLYCVNFVVALSLITNKEVRLESHFKLNAQKELPGYTSVFIVPTGVGASIGGYAGDAMPAAKLFASIADTVITHPNVMNGAMLYGTMPNIQYVEGWALDEFARGAYALSPMHYKGQKIGLLLDHNMELDLRVRHLQVADAARATLGLDMHACVITPRPIGVELKISSSGASWGSIDDTNSLREGAAKLIELGCTAIAVVVRFPEDEDEESIEKFEKYRQGVGVDAVAGVEALISHVITKAFHIPCAHAPAFLPTPPEPDVNPKACAEELGYTFLPCVLAYLHRAPSLVQLGSQDLAGRSDLITAADVDSVIVPANALGGPAVLSFLSLGKLIVAVTDNLTTMAADAKSLEIQDSANVVMARSYAEAAGLIAAHKAGILFESLTSRVSPIKVIDMSGS